MNYPCPKCQAGNEVDLSRMTAGGQVLDCLECNSRFWAIKEPFSLRAYKKQGDIFCTACGEKLGPSIICLKCGELFPYYHIIQTAKPVRRKVTTSPIKFSEINIRRGHLASPREVGESAGPAAKISRGTNKPLLVKASTVLLVCLLVALLGSVFQANKMESAYRKNYIFALYGLKTATDLSLSKCVQISEEIRNPIPGKPAISKEGIAQLNVARIEVEQVLGRLQDPPGKYKNSHDRIFKLYDSYQRLFTFTVSYKDQKEIDFRDSVTKLENDFLQKAKELKADLPEELSIELKESVVKYKNLKFLI